MAFSGTQQKCKACDKVVHFVESQSADGTIYHKNCFRCSHCNGRLVISNYSSIEGVLYCKPHFEQLFKENGATLMKRSLSSGKQQQGDAPKKQPSRMASFFSGTQDKCSVCKKTVYPLEKLTVEGEFYHKSCFKCTHGGCSLNPSSYAALDGYLYCKPHFSQLFKEKGSYNHLSKTASMRKNGQQEDDKSAEATEDTDPAAAPPAETAEEAAPAEAAEDAPVTSQDQ
ncbi:LIM domain-containing protein WLIM2b [Stylosanthes scabra]|uniref:LIM domain-containing protein WLIM2b n=1 Tax=Stylosanthes scabra TaxID=79078 RepID=A0ABU6XC74_9FABA|nr:LIM domain-containing protein WLIM2b [Stylosanthes scabra]